MRHLVGLVRPHLRSSRICCQDCRRHRCSGAAPLHGERHTGYLRNPVLCGCTTDLRFRAGLWGRPSLSGSLSQRPPLPGWPLRLCCHDANALRLLCAHASCWRPRPRRYACCDVGLCRLCGWARNSLTAQPGCGGVCGAHLGECGS